MKRPPCRYIIAFAVCTGTWIGNAAEPVHTTKQNQYLSAAPTNQPDFCLVLANHWSYTGIGWSSGLQSCVQSVTDSLAMADYTPSVKTSINLDAPAYAMIAEARPDVAVRLR